jgi:superfamily II DNA or RNA helicase
VPEEFFRRKRSQLPDMRVVRLDADPEHYRYAHADLGSYQVLAVKLPVPLGLPSHHEPFQPKRYWVLHTRQDDWLAITDPEHIKVVLPFLRKNGAQDASVQWDFHGHSKVKLQVAGWAVIAKCDLSDPRHYLLQPSQTHKWDKNGGKVFIPWTGEIGSSRKLWPDLAKKMAGVGIDWEGDDPAAPMSVRTQGDVTAVPGWTTAAPNGFLVRNYQREGIQFCLDRGMRALLADEMGIGKTVQAIGSAVASAANKILVVAPANGRWVWDREIRGWTGTDSIHHIETSLTPLQNVQWHIVTYDLLIVRPAFWTLDNPAEKAAVEAVVGSLRLPRGIPYPAKIRITKYHDKVPEFVSEEKIRKWCRTMRRLRNELLNNFLAHEFDLFIVDEAHRAKNEDAKRSLVLRDLSQHIPHVLLLTGTPMRNNAGEAGVLLGYVDAKAAEALSDERGYTLEDLKDSLAYYMIRRLKVDVLPELPEKIRQVQEIDRLDDEQLAFYYDALSWAQNEYAEAIKQGKSQNEARDAMRGGIETARTHLGMAKVLGGQVAEIVTNVVEQKDNVVVFCAHHDCSDALKEQLLRQGYTADIVDGRTPQHRRAEIVQDFQAGSIQVFIGGILAAGEAITLTAADTVIFVELDWVPAALRQAEDRIHRIGQERGCHIIHLLAHGKNLDSAMGRILLSKLEAINEALGETDQVFATAEESEMKATFDSVLAYVLKDRKYRKKFFPRGKKGEQKEA